MTTLRSTLNTRKFLPPAGKGPFVCNNTYIGVEIETEGSRVTAYDADKGLQYWSVTQDGSLKSDSPYEFILIEPMCGEILSLALQEIEEFLVSVHAKYPLNTGVHLHVNIGDLTFEELRKFTYLSIVTESALTQFSGGKFSNSFCLPWGNLLEDDMGAVGGFFAEGVHIGEVIGRYNTVNIASVFKLGSLEFRTMKGTGEYLRIKEWIDVILTLKRYSTRSDVILSQSLDYISSGRNLQEFLLSVWDRQTVRRMMHPELHRDMVRSSRIAKVGLATRAPFNSWLAEELGITVIRRGSSVQYGTDSALDSVSTPESLSFLFQ